MNDLEQLLYSFEHNEDRLHDISDPMVTFRKLREAAKLSEAIKLRENVKSPKWIKLRKLIKLPRRITLPKGIKLSEGIKLLNPVKLWNSIILSKPLILPKCGISRKIYCQRVKLNRCHEVSKECACNTCTPCKGAAPPLTPHTVDVDSVMSYAERRT